GHSAYVLDEIVGNLNLSYHLTNCMTHQYVAHPHILQRVQQLVKHRGCAAVDMTIGRFRSYRAWRRTIGLEFADRLFVRLHGFLPARMNRHDVTSTAPPSRRQADAAVSLGRVNRKAADGKWRGERYAEPSTRRAGGARRSRPP